MDDLDRNYELRLDWLDQLIDFYNSIDADLYDVAVPSCPGWTIRNVLAHHATGCIGWIVLQGHPADAWGSAVGKAMASVPADDAAGMFPGASRAFAAVLRSHDPRDRCTFHLNAAQDCGSHAWHSVSELALHRIGIEQALGQPVDTSGEQALDVLGWTTEIALSSFAATLTEGAPTDPVLLIAGPSSFLLGAGSPSTTVSGAPIDVLCLIWNRDYESSLVSIDGSEAALESWKSVPARAFQLRTRS